MKTMRKNAREHNINKVMQEVTAARLHTDNEESIKKIIINVKDCCKNELNKTKKSKGLFHVVDFRHECSRQSLFVKHNKVQYTKMAHNRWDN